MTTLSRRRQVHAQVVGITYLCHTCEDEYDVGNPTGRALQTEQRKARRHALAEGHDVEVISTRAQRYRR